MLVYPLAIGTWNLIIILILCLLIFGGKKVPELMKGLGKGIRSFREGLNEVEKEIGQAGESKPADKSDSASDGKNEDGTSAK